MKDVGARIPWARWKPALFDCLGAYSKQFFFSDLIAGITVGLVALPLAMAFGIASGVTPQAGIYTAILGGFLVSLLGGSKIQIGGPTGAFVVIVAGIVAKYGLSGLLMVTMMAGVILLFLGLTGLGTAVKFIPRPIVIGFTNGIALLIASTQIKDFFGLKVDNVPSEFVPRMRVLAEHFFTLNGPTVLLAFASLILILVVPKVLPKVPGTIVALILGTIAVMAFHLPVATIGTKFGGIPAGLPLFAIPKFRPDLLLLLLPSALTVAILAAVESLLSAVVSDSMTGDRHNSNAELVAQGVANLFTPLFGGIPVTGAIARTATNFRSGAKTPVSGIFHALTLLAVILVIAPLAKFVPLATLAAVLFVVAYNMGEWREIPSVLRLDLPEKSVWLITFALTVIADLTLAVEVGMALASLLYIYRVSQTTTVSKVTPQYISEGELHVLQGKEVPPFVTILRIHGPFLFGTTDQLTNETADIEKLSPIVILRLRNMTAIDATGCMRSKLSAIGSGNRDVPCFFAGLVCSRLNFWSQPSLCITLDARTSSPMFKPRSRAQPPSTQISQALDKNSRTNWRRQECEGIPTMNNYQPLSTVSKDLQTTEAVLLDFRQHDWITMVEKNGLTFLSGREAYKAKFILHLRRLNLNDAEIGMVLDERNPPYSLADVPKILGRPVVVRLSGSRPHIAGSLATKP